MTNSAGVVQNGLVLRMSVPVSGEMASLGPELASRLAEALGLPAGAAGDVGQAITDLSAEVGQPEADVEFEFLKREATLEIVAVVPTGAVPKFLAVSPDGSRLVVIHGQNLVAALRGKPVFIDHCHPFRRKIADSRAVEAVR